MPTKREAIKAAGAGAAAKLTIGSTEDDAKSEIASGSASSRVQGSVVFDARNLLFGGKAVRS